MFGLLKGVYSDCRPPALTYAVTSVFPLPNKALRIFVQQCSTAIKARCCLRCLPVRFSPGAFALALAGSGWCSVVGHSLLQSRLRGAMGKCVNVLCGTPTARNAQTGTSCTTSCAVWLFVVVPVPILYHHPAILSIGFLKIFQKSFQASKIGPKTAPYIVIYKYAYMHL